MCEVTMEDRDRIFYRDWLTANATRIGCVTLNVTFNTLPEKTKHCLHP